MGYPLLDEEVRIALETKAAKARIAPVASAEDILALREAAEDVLIAVPVARYAAQITSSTRTMKECSCGASPRGTIALVNLARSHALMRGRTYVLPDDIKYLAPYVLAHRVILTHEAKINGRDPKAVINSVLDSVAVPKLTEAEAKGL
ncbi:MAG: MoxR family ATPase [Coriobacteriales bacterium]|nr:MoxR family ATPase [Coriobacteriales bacterium]